MGFRGQGEKYAGMKRASIATNFLISLMKASPSTAGKAMRAADLLSRAMFLSGRNSRSWPWSFL